MFKACKFFFFAGKHLNIGYNGHGNFLVLFSRNESVQTLSIVFHDILTCQCYKKINKESR